jgi:hypothetical protein
LGEVKRGKISSTLKKQLGIWKARANTLSIKAGSKNKINTTNTDQHTEG